MSYLPDGRRLLLAAFVAVAVALLGVTIASASGARAAEPQLLPSPGVAIDLRVAQRVALNVGPGEHVRLVVEVAGVPRAGLVAADARLVVVRMSDGARIFDGRLADAHFVELGRVPLREHFRFAVSGTSAGRVVFRADWAASRAV
jgi:hypothetical protein